jgi:hypothetical protein
MLDVFFGVLAALAVREVYLELYSYVQFYLVKKRMNKSNEDLLAFKEELEDLLADDD